MTKTIVITEASSGIGEATAKFFAKKGLKIYATIANIDRIAAKFIFLYFI